MGRIRVGICSWADPTLVKGHIFYPSGVNTPESRLRHYAANFDLVEVDASFYTLDMGDASARWSEWVPDGFTFDVKAHALLTGHATAVPRLPADLRERLPAELLAKPRIYMKDLSPPLQGEVWDRFARLLSPLERSGHLGSLLFQYPPWFRPGEENEAVIEEAWERLGSVGLGLAVEFRAATWMQKRAERTLDFLRRRGVTYVCVDEPQGFESSVPAVAEVTNPRLAQVRFHGRNSELWERGASTAAERFNYRYSPDELREWVPRITAMAEQAQEVHVLMNNCYRDHAVVNAREVAVLLGAGV